MKWTAIFLCVSLLMCGIASAAEEALLETEDAGIDAFVHIDTFDATAATYLRFSLSGKVPWYLAAGVPLFAYGAPGLGTMRFLREQRCATIVASRAPELLHKHLKDFVNDGRTRRQLGLRARLVAVERFDARVQREALRGILAQAARRGARNPDGAEAGGGGRA